ncbi:MAG: hypothetical protein H6Q00_3355 [Holophagaceae bacterium]|nr:hypothetical protein [Holophagaceae bacterium]
MPACSSFQTGENDTFHECSFEADAELFPKCGIDLANLSSNWACIMSPSSLEDPLLRNGPYWPVWHSSRACS